MKQFWFSFWNRRWFRGLFWCGVMGITLVVLLLQWVNWTGARAWRNAVDTIQGAGETLDFRGVASNPVAEERNFCATPLLDKLAVKGDAVTEERRLRLKSVLLPEIEGGPPKPWLARGASTGVSVDLKAWADWWRRTTHKDGGGQSGEAAREILALMADREAVFAELARGLEREETRWTPEWKTRELPEFLFAMEVPHYTLVQSLTHVLTLRSIAAARAGESRTAHESLQMLLRLNRATLQDPLLIGVLVAATGAVHAAGTVWELCDAGVGDVSDFERLEAELTRMDFEKGLLLATRGELASAANAMAWMKKMRDARSMQMMLVPGGHDVSKTSWLEALVVGSIPAGWYDWNAAMLLNTQWEHLLKPLRDGGLMAAYKHAPVLEARLVEMKTSRNPANMMAVIAVPAFARISDRVLYAQCLMDQAVVACALQRHRLVHGEYPSSLEGLKRQDGRPLPADRMSGQSMGYERTADGRYRLWSVGWDGRDEGGKRGPGKGASAPSFAKREYEGDWVWDVVGE